MRKTAAILLIIGLLASLATPVFAQEAVMPITATVRHEGDVPVYPAAIASGEPIATLQDGERVSVSQLGLSFCKVATEQGEGYIPAQCLTFASADKARTYCVVAAKSSGKLTLRKEATTKSDSLGMFPNGTVAVALGPGDVFTYVYIGGKLGYMLTEHLQYTEAVAPAQALAVIINPKAEDKPIAVKLRMRPSRSASEAGEYPSGTEVSVISIQGDWCEVAFDGIYGFMMTEYLQVTQQAEDAAAP